MTRIYRWHNVIESIRSCCCRVWNFHHVDSLSGSPQTSNRSKQLLANLPTYRPKPFPEFFAEGSERLMRNTSRPWYDIETVTADHERHSIPICQRWPNDDFFENDGLDVVTVDFTHFSLTHVSCRTFLVTHQTSFSFCLPTAVLSVRVVLYTARHLFNISCSFGCPHHQ